MPAVVKFRATLTSRVRKVTAAQMAAVTRAVEETVTAIEQDVKGGPHAAPYQTGNLRRSYHRKMVSKTEGVVGSDPGIAEYAPFVEFGTSKMSPRPHLVPATEAQREPFADRVRRAIGGV